MSNFSKDHPSIRVFAPPGGRSANIFGVPEPEAPATAKKNHMESDIFGCKKDQTDSAPAKQTRNVTNNIFGSQPEQAAPKHNMYSDKNKSTIFDEAPPQQPSNKPDRQRSNIFGTDEPVQSTSTRAVSDKYKSNIFGNADDDAQNKRQPGTRQGLRDPNASRMGYNPINGESYSTKDGLNSKVEPIETVKESDETSKPVEEEQDGQQAENATTEPSTNSTQNGNTEPASEKQTNGHTNGTNGHTNGANGHTNGTNGHTNGTNGHTNGTNGHTTTKNAPTTVRVVHPPGGRSNGPLW